MGDAERGPDISFTRAGKVRTATVLAIVAAAGLVAAGVIGIASGPSDGNKGSTGARKATGLDVYAVQQMSFDISTTALGEMKAKNQVELRNELESETTVTEIVPEGTYVKKGDVLVRLNAESIQMRLDEELLQLKTAQAGAIEAEAAYSIQLSENDSSLRAAKLKLDLARLDLQKWIEGEVASKRLELTHEIDRATKDEERLREKFEKSKELEKQGFLSVDQRKQDGLAYDQAKASLEKAILAKRVYEEFEYPKEQKTRQSAVEEADAELARTIKLNESRLASKEADRANKQESLAIRKDQIAKYRAQIESASIVAPQDGLVVYSTSIDQMRWGNDSGPLQVGSKVWPNQGLIVLPDTSEMIAAVRVHESLASRVRPGQRATIKVDAVGDKRFTGVVEGVGILAEQTSRWMDPNLREYTVRILLEKVPGDDAAARIRPSMRAEAELMLGRVEDAIAVPVQAVFNEGMLRYVFVSDDPGGAGGRWERRPVMVGQRSDRFAAISAGLKPGERVLLRKPDAGEVNNRPWKAEELAAVGLMQNDKGEIVFAGAPNGAGRGGPAGGRRGPRPDGAGGAPAIPVAHQDANAPKTEEPATGEPEDDVSTEDKSDDDNASAQEEAAKPAEPVAAQTH